MPIIYNKIDSTSYLRFSFEEDNVSLHKTTASVACAANHSLMHWMLSYTHKRMNAVSHSLHDVVNRGVSQY
jgi:hypothetical protein